MSTTGYFEESPGVKSSSRLNTSIVIYAALFMAAFVLVAGVATKQPILLCATSAGTLFGTIAGSAMIYQNQQKREETKYKTMIKRQPDTNL
jgi:hypothetical protein